MAEQRTDTPVQRAATPAPAGARERFVRPTVEDLGGLTLVTLTQSIPVGP